jgi:hypothetical protein
MPQYVSIDDGTPQRKSNGSRILLGALCATAAAGLLVALTAGITESPSLANRVVLMRKHMLSSHEREEFRQFQLSQMIPKIVSKPAPGSGWPYADEPANRLGPLGASVYAAPPERRDAMKQSIMRSFQPRPDLHLHLQRLEGQYPAATANASVGESQVVVENSTTTTVISTAAIVQDEQNPGNYSDTNPPCFTATDCHTRAMANHLYETNDANGELPTYDGDTMEMIAAMQKQVCICICVCIGLCVYVNSMDMVAAMQKQVCICMCVCVCIHHGDDSCHAEAGMHMYMSMCMYAPWK